MPTASLPNLRRPRLGSPGGRSRAAITGLDIEPGEVVAAEVDVVDGGIVVRRAVAAEIDHALVHDGEVRDPVALGAWLKQFFSEHRFPRRVRVGLASQRAVGRIVELPPLQDRDDLAAAVRMTAQEHIAMPLSDAVLDHRSLGIIETADGPRTRVVIAAAQRAPITGMVAALRAAGLRAEGIDLSAFALVRGLQASATASADEPVLYVNVGGVTTLAIARGTICELNRVSAIGLETLAGRLAERDGVSVEHARVRITDFGQTEDPKALQVLDTGLAELADDLSKTIEFHANQEGGAPVAAVLVSGAGASIPNFADVLGQHLGRTVTCAAPPVAEAASMGGVAPERVSIAAGLAVAEVPA